MKFFKADKGWGVRSPVLPYGCDAWVHYSAIDAEGSRELPPGERVDFEYQAAQQDSFRYRATRVAGPEPVMPSGPVGMSESEQQ